uniref:Uncharacterized protein n=1 Tax=Oryza rufipogon TaxID=4529 RepID=A0A0E0NRE2_ORYRU
MLGLRGLVAASPVTAPRRRGRCSAATAATSAPEKTAGHVGRLPLAIVPAAAASLSLVLWSSPAENQKKYAEFDSRFKSSQVLKDLLEKSKQNKLKNEREIQDKYCLRGAEWGVGDCSTEGMSDQEKEDFIAELKKRTGQE